MLEKAMLIDVECPLLLADHKEEEEEELKESTMHAAPRLSDLLHGSK